MNDDELDYDIYESLLSHPLATNRGEDLHQEQVMLYLLQMLATTKDYLPNMDDAGQAEDMADMIETCNRIWEEFSSGF